MKKYTIYLITTLLLYFCYSCRMPQYIPVESVKTEYRDKILRDSVYMFDSIYVKEKGDTLIMERFRYLYKNKLIRDSIFICDTIRVPHPVEVIKQVKKPLSGWQNFQVWCGRIALAIFMFAFLFFVLIRKRF
jgi:ABC-type multidrug transport system permease subunit